MPRVLEHQEVITTPESKGMRTIPSARGVAVNFNELKAWRESRLIVPHSIPGARLHRHAEFARLKTLAYTNPLQACDREWLQLDPQTIGEFGGMVPPQIVTDFAGLDDANWTPPDSQIAVGPHHLIAAVNSTFAVFDKRGGELLRRTLSDVFGRLVEDAIIYSPRVLYDQFRGCWVMAACARSVDGQRSWFLLAYSDNGNPLDEWRLWALSAGDGLLKTPYWPEGLGLSVDNTLLTLTANMFNAQGDFVYSKLRVLNVREIQLGGIVHGWDFWQLQNADGTPAFGVQPAVNLRGAGAQYLLNATTSGQGMTLWAVTQPMRQSPRLMRRFLPTAKFHMPPNAYQHSTGIEIGLGDTRLVNVVFRHGLLWAAHTVAANWRDATNTAAIHWVQINPRAGCVMQQGVFGSPRRHYFCPAVTVDGEGNMLMVFNRVSDLETPSICVTGRCPTDEAGWLQPSELLIHSPTSTFCEWSNFNGVAIAPDESEAWIMSQYVATDSDMPTWIGAITHADCDVSMVRNYSRQSVYV